MKKNVMIIFVVLFMFIFCINISFATENEGNETKKVEASLIIPENVYFAYKVKFELKGDNGFKETYVLSQINEFSETIELNNGAYIITSCFVEGPHGGYFSVSCPVQSFKINNDSPNLTKLTFDLLTGADNDDEYDADEEINIPNEDDVPEVENLSESERQEALKNMPEVKEAKKKNRIGNIVSVIVTILLLGGIGFAYRYIKNRE